MDLAVKCDKCKQLLDNPLSTVLAIKMSFMTMNRFTDLDVGLDEKLNYAMNKSKLVLCSSCAEKLKSFMQNNL